MASRFPPIFSLNTGLLSTQDMTPEEEAAWLADQQDLYGTQIAPTPLPEEPATDTSSEEDAVDYTSEDAPTDTPPDEGPMVVDITNDPLAPLPGGEPDPLAPLPEGVTETTPVEKPKGEPLVVEAKNEKKKEPLVVDVNDQSVEGAMQDIIDKRGQQQPPITATLGGVAKAHTTADKADANRPTSNYAVDLTKAAYLNRVNQEVNGRLWNAKPMEMLTEARRIAKEEFGDPDLAKANFGFSNIVEYRRKAGANARPSPVGWAAVGKENGEAVSDTQASRIRGGRNFLGTMWAATEAAEEALGVDSKNAANQRRYYGAIADALPPGLTARQVSSFKDAINFAVQTSIEQAPNFVASMDTAMVGSVLAGSVGAAMGAFGSSFPMELGQIQQGIKDIDPDAKANWKSFLLSGGAAALDSVLPGKVGSMLTARLGKDVADQIALRMLLMPATEARLAAFKQVAASGAKGMAVEGSTEGLQTAIEEVAAAEATGTDIKPDLLGRMFDAAVAGALIGGPASASGTVAENEQARQAVIGEMGNAQYDTRGAVVAGQSPSQAAGQVSGTPSTPREARPLVVAAEDRGPTIIVRTTRTPVAADGTEEKFQIPNGKVTSTFGPRRTFRTENGMMASRNHAGIDIALPMGTPVPAGASGVVASANPNAGGYGKQVVIQHSDGTTSSYSHLSKIDVAVGDQVAQGEIVGNVGKTGNATGPHLHLERRNRRGEAVNPLTGGRVIVAQNEDGDLTDNTDWEASQKEIDNFYDDAFDQQQAEAEYEDATGQRLEPLPAPETAPEEAVATIARGDESIQPEPAPKRGVADIVAEVVAGPGAQDIAAAATADLDAAKTSNKAKIALASLKTPERDLTQAGPGEEPVFTDNTGTEVAGFHTPETGDFRAVGEPYNVATAQPETTLPAQPPAEPTPATIQGPAIEPVGAQTEASDAVPAVEQPPVEQPPVEPPPVEQPPVGNAATTDQLELERKQRLLDALPSAPANQPFAVREARVNGQAVGLGLQSAPPLTSMSKAERTAFSLGVQEGQKALAQEGAGDFVAAVSSKETSATTPVATKSSAPPQKVSAKEARAIDDRVGKIEDKLFDLENEGTKGQVRIYMQRLIREGVLPADAVKNLSYVFSDRDMGVEDLTSEIRTDVQMWADEQKAKKAEPAPEKKAPTKKKTKARVDEEPQTGQKANKEATNEQNAQAERAERGGLSPDEQRPQERDAGTGEWVRPHLNKDGTYSLQHFGPEGLTETDPSRWGQSKALSPSERAYIEKAPPRTYFGIHTDEPGGYKREFHAGVPRYEARIPAERLYDVREDPDNLWVRGNPAAGETAIKNAGYAGYWYKNNELGLVSVVFEPIKVTPAKTTKDIKSSVGLRADVRVRTLDAGDWLTDKVVADVVATLHEMALLGRAGLKVEVVDKIAQGKVLGQFNPNHMLISIAAMNARNKKRVVKHEVIHFAREAGLFNTEEWRTLANWARTHKGLMAWAKSAYADYNLTEDEIVEEAVAEGFARWDGGRLQDISMLSHPIERLFERLANFIRAIRDALTGRGISAQQIEEAAALFNDLATGKQVKKVDERSSKYTVTFGKKRPAWQEALSREMLSGNISVAERHFLESNPSAAIKDQSAFHGSRLDNIDRFRTSFVGTGEGAQAFGWGLYFAQRQDVAEWYRKKVILEKTSRDPVDLIIRVGDTPLRDFFAGHDNGAVYEAADRIMNFFGQGNKPYNGWLDALHAEFDNDISDWVRLSEKDLEGGHAAEAQAEIDALLTSQQNVGFVFDALNNPQNRPNINVKPVEGGKVYKVEVPENDQLLDLDKRLSEQSPQVKEALEKLRHQLIDADATIHGQTIDEIGDEFWELSGLTLSRVIMPNAIYNGVRPTGEISQELETAFASGSAQMATSIWLRDNGIPGARYHDRESRNGQPYGTANFVIFDDDHIKMADEMATNGQRPVKNRVIKTSINSPLSDPANPNPGIFRRLHDNTMGLLGAIAGKDVDTSDNLIDAFKRKITNRYQQIIKTQERSAQMAGVDRLPSGQNPMEMITADERGYKLQHLTENMVRPMLKEMARRGVSLEDLGLYLYARHAPHRNARIAKINPEFRAPANPGSGMTDAEAIQIMADFAADGKMGDLSSVATYIDQMIAQAQQERLNSGILSHQDAAAGFSPGDFYVPLRGNEEIEPEFEMDFPLAARKGGGYSVSGQEGHRMFGRKSKADLEEIVGYTITQAQDAIDRGYRNQVGQNMLAMFRATPDPDFVKIDRVKRVPVWNKKAGKVEYQMQTRITDPKEQQRTVYVKEGGHVVKMTFNDQNPSAMRFVKAAKNLGATEMHRALQLISAFTRLWSKSNTQWNLDFILSNAVKDVQTGLLNAKTLDQKTLRRKMIKNILSLRPLMASLMGSTHPAGTGFTSSNPWSQTYAEFEANGGKLNYGQMTPLEDAVKEARRELKYHSRKLHPMKVLGEVFNWIDHLNSGFENMTRLAAYKALRDLGVEPKQAAVAVRELTTNFQQHGEWGPKVNALYGFANASVIGGARFMNTVRKAPHLAAGLMVVGAMMDMLNHLGDPDKWDKWSEEDKHGNLIIDLPDRFGFNIKIPSGYGLNAFITAGRKMSELWRDKKNKDGTQMSILDAASDTALGFANSFSPVTGNSWQNILSPTATDPIVNIYRNENNWGRPIMPEQPFRKEQQKPQSQMAFDNTSQFWKGLAETMNMVGGGNEVVPGAGWLDNSPEAYKHIAEETVGGAGRTTLRAFNAVEKAATGQDVGLNDIPIVRRFAGNPYGAATAKDEQLGQFYERLNDGRVAIAQAKEMLARYGRDSREYQEFRKEHQPIIEFADTIDEAEKRLRAYNAAENAAERGSERVTGLKRRDRKAIFKATRIVVPANRKLTDEEVAAIKAKVKAKKERLALLFNDKYTVVVMKKGE